MKLVTIVADTAAEALAEAHRRLGPEAIIVNVRKTPAPGLARIWKKGKIELQAAVPSPPPAPAPKTPGAAAAPQNSLEPQQVFPPASVMRKRYGFNPPTKNPPANEPAPRNGKKDSSDASLESLLSEAFGELPRNPAPAAKPNRESSPEEKLNLVQMLEKLGILPLHAQWVADQVRAPLGGMRLNLREEFNQVQDFLVEHWQRLASQALRRAHKVRVLVGTPGVGKSTCLCKWLTQEVLIDNHPARVWRLDGLRANTAEFVTIHGEILEVPVERFWSPPENADAPGEGMVQFVDYPGIALDDAEGMAALGETIHQFGSVDVFLVLNAAYDLNLLLQHVRAFSVLPLTGLILTHLDEETRWSKFWNLLLGTKLPILYLSAGQNIPGQFSPASPSSLFGITPPV